MYKNDSSFFDLLKKYHNVFFKLLKNTIFFKIYMNILNMNY